MGQPALVIPNLAGDVAVREMASFCLNGLCVQDLFLLWVMIVIFAVFVLRSISDAVVGV